MVLTNILEKNTLSFPDFPDPLNSFHTSVKRKCNLSSQSGSFIAQLQNSVFLRCMVKSPSLPVTTVTIFHIKRLYLESLSWCLQIFWKKNTLSFPDFPDPLNSFQTSVKRKCNLSNQSGSFIAQLQNSVFLRCMVKSPSLPVTTVTIFHIERLYLESLSWCLQIFWKKFPRFPRFSRPSKQFPDKCKV